MLVLEEAEDLNSSAVKVSAGVKNVGTSSENGCDGNHGAGAPPTAASAASSPPRTIECERPVFFIWSQLFTDTRGCLLCFQWKMLST